MGIARYQEFNISRQRKEKVPVLLIEIQLEIQLEYFDILEPTQIANNKKQ